MNKQFAIGFAFGLILFIGINLAAAHIASDCGLPAVFSRDICADDIARAGWPLRFYEEGGFDYRNTFQGGFLTLDPAIGILFAGTFGWLISRPREVEFSSLIGGCMEIIFAVITFILSIGGAICAVVVPIAVFVGLGIYLYRRSKMRVAVKQSAQDWPGTMGVVTMSTIQIRRTSRNRSEIPVVGYQYQVNGQTYTGGTIKAGEQFFNVRLMGDAQKTVERYPVGAQVMVYYNPANPAESALER